MRGHDDRSTARRNGSQPIAESSYVAASGARAQPAADHGRGRQAWDRGSALLDRRASRGDPSEGVGRWPTPRPLWWLVPRPSSLLRGSPLGRVMPCLRASVHLCSVCRSRRCTPRPNRRDRASAPPARRPRCTPGQRGPRRSVPRRPTPPPRRRQARKAGSGAPGSRPRRQRVLGERRDQGHAAPCAPSHARQPRPSLCPSPRGMPRALPTWSAVAPVGLRRSDSESVTGAWARARTHAGGSTRGVRPVGGSRQRRRAPMPGAHRRVGQRPAPGGR